MYCRKCGKKIDYDSEYCYECLNEEMIFGTDDSKKKMPEPSISKATGLAKSIVTLALCVVSVFFAYWAFIFELLMPLRNTTPYVITFSVLAIVILIIPAIFMKQSFSLFKRVNKEYNVKLVPLLVLNCVAIGAIAVMLVVMFLVVIFATFVIPAIMTAAL
jgi:hypothetical protein